MKTLKTMAIISIIWLSLLFLVMVNQEGFYKAMYETVLGCSIFMFLYSIAFSIVVLVKAYSPEKSFFTSQKMQNGGDYNSDLLKLNELKEKGIITEVQFAEKREQILFLLSNDLRNFAKQN